MFSSNSTRGKHYILRCPQYQWQIAAVDTVHLCVHHTLGALSTLCVLCAHTHTHIKHSLGRNLELVQAALICGTYTGQHPTCGHVNVCTQSKCGEPKHPPKWIMGNQLWWIRQRQQRSHPRDRNQRMYFPPSFTPPSNQPALSEQDSGFWWVLLASSPFRLEWNKTESRSGRLQEHEHMFCMYKHHTYSTASVTHGHTYTCMHAHTQKTKRNKDIHSKHTH